MDTKEVSGELRRIYRRLFAMSQTLPDPVRVHTGQAVLCLMDATDELEWNAMTNGRAWLRRQP